MLGAPSLMLLLVRARYVFQRCVFFLVLVKCFDFYSLTVPSLSPQNLHKLFFFCSFFHKTIYSLWGKDEQTIV